MVTDLETLFPGLHGTTYQITSSQDNLYNCVAWAAGDPAHWWWPDSASGSFWPTGAPRAETVDAFRTAFATLGYVESVDDTLEAGVEKIALFADAALLARHVARQLPTGRWTSKLGELEDIEHDLRALEGSEYGNVVLVMKRSIAGSG
jgi:hypothetical protein